MTNNLERDKKRFTMRHPKVLGEITVEYDKDRWTAKTEGGELLDGIMFRDLYDSVLELRRYVHYRLTRFLNQDR